MSHVSSNPTNQDMTLSFQNKDANETVGLIEMDPMQNMSALVSRSYENEEMTQANCHSESKRIPITCSRITANCVQSHQRSRVLGTVLLANVKQLKVELLFEYERLQGLIEKRS